MSDFKRGHWVRLVGIGGELDSFFVADELAPAGREDFTDAYLTAAISLKLDSRQPDSWTLSGGDTIVIEEGVSEF